MSLTQGEQLAADLRTFFDAPLSEPAYEAEARLREFARNRVPQGPGNEAAEAGAVPDDEIRALSFRIAAGADVQPGDTLIVATGEQWVDMAEQARLRDRVKARIPGLADVVFVPGVRVAAYRPHRIEVAKPYPDSDGSGS